MAVAVGVAVDVGVAVSVGVPKLNWKLLKVDQTESLIHPFRL